MRSKYQVQKEPIVSRPLFIIYLVGLYTGLVLLIIGIPLLLDGNEDEALPWILLGVLLNVGASVVMLVMLYRFWDFTIREMKASGLTPAIDSPGKAIGFLFIPFYNFYWIFMTYGKLPKDLNALAESRNVKERLPADTGTIIALLVLVGVIPYVGYVTSFISAFIMIPLFTRRIIRFVEDIPAAETKPAEDIKLDRTETLQYFETIHDHNQVFDEKKYGINFPAGIGLFIGLVITHLIWILGDPALRGGFYLNLLARYYLPMIIIDVFLVSTFLLVIHSIKKDMILFITYGIALVILSILKGLVFKYSLLRIQEMDGTGISFWGIFSVFIFAAFFMAGLVYSIRYYGIKWWSISGGLVCAYLAAYFLTELIGLTLGSGFFFRFKFLLLSFITYAIQGFALWYGIRYFALKKGIVSG